MSQRDPLVRLKHMLEYAREAVKMAKGKDAEHLDQDRKLALALTHLVELVGEAASQVHKESEESIPMFRGRKLSACATGLSMAMTLWTIRFFGIPSSKIFRRS
jgi:uncharacterized protein with HEPN domain